MAQAAQHHPEGSRGFPLPRTRVNDDESSIRDGLGHAPILNCLAPLYALRIRIAALGAFGLLRRQVGLRHDHSPSARIVS
jgi:hypothetical protein